MAAEILFPEILSYQTIDRKPIPTAISRSRRRRLDKRMKCLQVVQKPFSDMSRFGDDVAAKKMKMVMPESALVQQPDVCRLNEVDDAEKKRMDPLESFADQFSDLPLHGDKEAVMNWKMALSLSSPNQLSDPINDDKDINLGMADLPIHRDIYPQMKKRMKRLAFSSDSGQGRYGLIPCAGSYKGCLLRIRL